MTTPLPPRTAANDKLIAATPYANLTQRQKDYAARYGVKLQAAPIAAPPIAAPPSPAPDKGGWMSPSTGAGVVTPPVQTPDLAAADKTAGQRDALALIKATLASYGLPDSLGDWAWSELVAGKGMAEIMLDLRQRPEFKAEFPEIDARTKAGLAPLSPGDIVSYRDSATQIMRAAGLPAGFFDSHDDFTKFLVGDVSISELNDRVQLAKDATFSIPEQAKTRLAQEFGVAPGSGVLTAFFLDPDKALPLITRDVNAARVGGRADAAGYAGLSNDTARTLVDQGVSDSQAQQGFTDLASQSELFQSLNSGEDTIDQQTQLGAMFGGNAGMQQRIERRRAGRKAEFGGSSNFAETQGGIKGLGSANSG